MITLEEAIALAEDWEQSKCASTSAQVGRVLLHEIIRLRVEINSNNEFFSPDLVLSAVKRSKEIAGK